VIPPDKFGHLWIGTVLGLSALWLGWLGVLPVISYAAGKEAWDHAHPPDKADPWDFLATMAGGAIGILAIMAHRMWP
jgi:hypothetical protein